VYRSGLFYYFYYLSIGWGFLLFVHQSGLFIVCVPVGAFSYLTENEKKSTMYREQSSLYCGRLPGNCFCIRNAMPLRQIVLMVKKSSQCSDHVKDRAKDRVKIV
jgi:hypothetical protein